MYARVSYYGTRAKLRGICMCIKAIFTPEMKAKLENLKGTLSFALPNKKLEVADTEFHNNVMYINICPV